MLNGWIHYKWSFSIAMLPESNHPLICSRYIKHIWYFVGSIDSTNWITYIIYHHLPTWDIQNQPSICSTNVKIPLSLESLDITDPWWLKKVWARLLRPIHQWSPTTMRQGRPTWAEHSGQRIAPCDLSSHSDTHLGWKWCWHATKRTTSWSALAGISMGISSIWAHPKDWSANQLPFVRKNTTIPKPHPAQSAVFTHCESRTKTCTLW